MKILGYEIRKYISKAEQIDNCKEAYENYKRHTFYEWDMQKGEYFAAIRDIPWIVVGRSGRWILIGSHSTYAKGCIKKINFPSVDEVCDRSEFFCYRFVRPEKLLTTISLMPFHSTQVLQMKKIMFNDKYGLTKAVLEGRKTQTRRVIKSLNDAYNIDSIEMGIDCHGKIYFTPYIEGKATQDIYPSYQLEEVAVAMCYGNCGTWLFPYAEYGKEPGYVNKMFVEAELMPYRIRITNVRVERLQDISEEDCLKEGIKRKNERYVVENQKGVCFYTNDPILAFRFLIDKTCGKGTWNSNPWVFVYDFELVKYHS